MVRLVKIQCKWLVSQKGKFKNHNCALEQITRSILFMVKIWNVLINNVALLRMSMYVSRSRLVWMLSNKQYKESNYCTWKPCHIYVANISAWVHLLWKQVIWCNLICVKMVWEGAKHCSCIASIFLPFSSSNTMVTAQISSPLIDNGFQRENRPWETCLQSKLCRLLPKDPPLCHSQNYLLLTGKKNAVSPLIFPGRV